MEKEGVVHRVRLAVLGLIMFGSVTVFTQLPALAVGRVTLAWDAPADPNVAGYIINYGVAGSTYTNAVSVGNVTSASISNLVEGATYFFAAKSLNEANVESDFSNEASYSVPVIVNPNQPPTLNTISDVTIGEDASQQTLNVSGIGSGALNENQTLIVTVASSNTGLIPNPTVAYTSPNSTGTLTFKPVTNANGAATITVTVNDGATSNNLVTRSFTVTATPVNDSPTLNAISNLTINENAANQTNNISGIGSGASNESQTLTVTAVSSNPDVIPNPTVIYTSPGATGKLAFKPVAYASGSATITVTVNDGGPNNNLVTRTYTVTVNPVNQAPTLNAINNLTINEGSGLQTVNLTGITSGMTNENQTLTITATSSNPSLIPNPTVTYTSPDTDGTLSFTPVTYAYGTSTITVTVNDGGTSASTLTRTFTVTVGSVNQPPTLDPVGDLTIIEDGESGLGTRAVNLSGISSGAPNENQTLAVNAVSSNPGLIPNPTVNYTSPNASGTISFTPASGVYGTARLTVTVTDGGASNNVVTRAFNVAITPVNEPPTLDPIASIAITENTGAQTVSLSGITSGATNEYQSLSVTAISSKPELIPNPTANYTSPNSTGSLSFTPVTDTFGGAAITVTVSDGQANGTVTRTFWVTVNPAVAQLSIGSAVLQVGQNGSVPVNVSSSEGVKDLSVVLDIPAGHLTNLALQALAPEVDPALATIVPQSSTTALLHLVAKPGQSIVGFKQIAQLTFSAITNQSAFVPIIPLPFSATKADGSPLTDRPAQAGRAVVVGKEALVEATIDPGNNRVLILYGKPTASFAIEYSTSQISPRIWTRLGSGFSLTTLATPVPLPNGLPSLVLYRAAQLSAAP